MDIDTLSERSEEEGDREQERQPRQRSRRPSGRKRSMSRERSVAKIRWSSIRYVNVSYKMLFFYCQGIAGDVTKLAMKTGNVEKMFSLEVSFISLRSIFS